ncbi:MAG TPA: NAD(P)-dependent oxidoreductase [Candidatus Bathyarchaeia archaeon]|nr:NAD(P)-dependent oxidoreductase [Candidatus Bathyarchaeia archaeon]
MGVIGLGMMGSQIALRLALKGHKVTVFNRDRSKMEKLLTNGTTNLKIANQPKEIGDSSDMAIVCVKDYQAVSNVSFMTGGLIETTNPDLVVIQCSTISPHESSEIADLYSKRQIKMLSVPMLGGTTAVAKGEITLIGAGPKAAYEFAEPILKDLSTQIFYIGSDHRTVSALKLAININIALITLALAEGLVFARGSGIDTDTFVKILNSTYFKTGISERKGPRIVNDDYTASFYLTNMVKDLDLALRTAYSSGLTLPTTATAEALYRASEAFGLSMKDYTSVASYILKLNGFNTFQTDSR